MPRKDNANTPASAQAQQDAVSEGIENFELPRALVTRIARSAVPENAKLQKDTVLSLVKGATVFINYLAATAHEVSTSKQHKSISASDVFKALELIEFADLIPPLQAELQGALTTTSAPSPLCESLTHPTYPVYRELAKSKKGSSAGGGSASAPAARNKTSTAAQRGKGKERTTETSESSVSAPLPNALGALSLEPQLEVQVHIPPEAPDADVETSAIPERDDNEGDDDDDDQTEAEPELEPEPDEAEEDEAEDVDERDEDVDMNMNMGADLAEDGDDMEDDDIE
ncbi:hypothetical protein BJV78DRAFT_731264 [Lactifluus subvellereus]|nr:hypothetical protein BJV78DRAFT_731264 [Lactifluus subvellereus]